MLSHIGQDSIKEHGRLDAYEKRHMKLKHKCLGSVSIALKIC
jgi:hypothetical protein